jgi:hypothetical protein
VIADCVLAGALVALRVVPDDAALLLWLGACGGHALLLAGELSGGTQRGDQPARLWRFAVWSALAALSMPILTTLGFGPRGTAQPILALLAALAVAVAALVSVRRIVPSEERRAVVRRESAVPLTQLGAIGCLVAGPLALFFAWLGGYQAGPIDSAVSLMPAGLGGWAAGLIADPRSAAQTAWIDRVGRIARQASLLLFHGVLAVERALRALIRRIALALAAPARDLHTGDAQEYLLFLVGVAVLAVVLPLLR